MKRIILAALLLLSAMGSHAQQKDIYMFCYFKNNGQDGLHLAYSMDGYQWTALKGDSSFLKPMVSNDKIMRDPCIIRGGDGLFHLVWTDSWTDRGIGYASSKDLIHWSDEVQLPVMEKESTAQNCWAPEITYDAPSKTYMIYWATTIPGRFPQADTSAEGKKYNHRIYYETTKDFVTYSDTKLLYDPGFSVIDATIAKQGKGYMMVLKNETKAPPAKNLHLAFADKLTGPYSKPTEKITPEYWTEGPTTLFLGDKWLIYFDRYREHRYGAIVSTDLKNWTDISDKISMPKGIRHGTIFKITPEEFAALSKN